MDISNILKNNLIADVENTCGVTLNEEVKERLKRHFEITIGTYNLEVSSCEESDKTIQQVDTVYSDRLFQWDSEKYDRLCLKHFGNIGQYWYNRTPDQIEQFLRDYLGEENLVLCSIEHSLNKSTGYPIWRFDYIYKHGN